MLSDQIEYFFYIIQYFLHPHRYCSFTQRFVLFILGFSKVTFWSILIMLLISQNLFDLACCNMFFFYQGIFYDSCRVRKLMSKLVLRSFWLDIC